MVKDMIIGTRHNFPGASRLISILELELELAAGVMIIAIVIIIKGSAQLLPLLLHGTYQTHLTVLVQIHELILKLVKPSSLRYCNFHRDRDNTQY